LESGIEQGDILLISIPAAFLVNVLSKIDKSLFKNKKMVVAIKGLLSEKILPLHNYFEQFIGIP